MMYKELIDKMIRIRGHAILCAFAALSILMILEPASAQIFYADFEDSSGDNDPALWVADNTGQAWGIANFPGTGRGLKNLNEGCGTSGNTPLPGVTDFTDGIIQLDMSWADDDSWGVVFRKTADDAGYLVVFGYIETPSVIVADLAKGCATTGNCLDQVQCENNPDNTLIEVPNALGTNLTQDLSVSYTGRIEVQGDMIRVWFLPTADIDDPLGDLGEPIVEIQDSAHTGPGSVGIWQESQGGSMIDNVIIFMPGGQPLARRPDPKNGAMLNTTWTSISWVPGDWAASHDVYIGDNFDDVNSGAANTFIGNQTASTLVAGFPGYPLPDGLVPGTTYYWRIDEVNDANAASPWKGDIWSFWIPPNTAYDPVPADGSKFVEAEPALTWTGGYGAKLHTVYFGDNLDDVSNATGAPYVPAATFSPPGPLVAGKVYYWRVDEFDPPFTHKGDVWSFEVAAEGGGVKAEYFSGMNFNALAATRTDPQIDFNWGDPGGPDPAVGDDQFSARWTGQVEAVFTETYTFYTNSDDGVRLWVDGKRLINNWTDHGATENTGKIDLEAGKKYSLVMEYYENGGGAIAELRWSSPRTAKQLIPSAALSLLTKAHTPSPRNGDVGAKLAGNLTWKPGDSATSHEVYFGTDADAVGNATKASPEYKGSRQPGSESFDPGKLAFNTAYFWRVDEVSAGGTVAGDVWSFNTGDFLLVEDFESYNDIEPPDTASNRIFDKWIDGFGTTTNGALAGNDLPPYAELNDVHGGQQALPCRYDNAGKTSEATMTLVWPRDWTEEGVTKLSLWFKGASGNSAERMFVALGNSVVYHDDPAATQTSRWTEWVIDLSAFAGANLTNVNAITIGFGTRGAPAAGGGTGTVRFDDIRLYR